jgi:hypothetical protein
MVPLALLASPMHALRAPAVCWGVWFPSLRGRSAAYATDTRAFGVRSAHYLDGTRASPSRRPRCLKSSRQLSLSECQGYSGGMSARSHPATPPCFEHAFLFCVA